MFFVSTRLSTLQFYSSGHLQYMNYCMHYKKSIGVCHIRFCHHILSLAVLHVTSIERVSSQTLNDVLHC